MEPIQLELNIKNESEEDVKLSAMQKQIDAMSDSMGKVRRKLFAEVSEMKKQVATLQSENQLLKDILRDLKNEKTQWSYGENGFLFDIREATG